MGCSQRRLTAFLMVTAGLFLGCAETSRQVTVCHDPSLTAFFEAAGERFQSNHPGIRVISQAQGSLEALPAVGQGVACDLVASTDWRLLELFLTAEEAVAGTVFMGDEIVLATARPLLLESEQQQKRWRENWPRLLFSEKRTYGIVDPNRDPSGYYSHLAWKLAEIQYRNPGLYRRFLHNLTEEQTFPHWDDLTQAMQSEQVDFAFLYQSAAAQKGWEHIRFPAPVSLGEESQSDRYRQVFLEVEGGGGPGEDFKIDGAPIRYGLCRLRNAGDEADWLMEYLLSPEASDLARRLGYVSVPQRSISGLRPE